MRQGSRPECCPSGDGPAASSITGIACWGSQYGRFTGVRVFETAPPWVRADPMNSREAEQAMPLDQFIAEAMAVFATDADEILVESAKPSVRRP
jgi:hypothetical protein